MAKKIRLSNEQIQRRIRANEEKEKVFRNNAMNEVIRVGIEQKLLPITFQRLIGDNFNTPVWQMIANTKGNFPFLKVRDKETDSFLAKINYRRLIYSIPQKNQTENIRKLIYIQNIAFPTLVGRFASYAYNSFLTALKHAIYSKAFHFTESEKVTLKKIGIELPSTSASNYIPVENFSGNEDFLGVCLGGKKCKARKKLRQDNRKNRKENRIKRRNILTEKKAAKKDGLVLENEANKSTNELLKELTQPQEQAQSRQIQVEQQNALPPNPPKKEDNTLLWVGGGFGTLIILGLIIFLVLKK